MLKEPSIKIKVIKITNFFPFTSFWSHLVTALHPWFSYKIELEKLAQNKRIYCTN
jgi:hypothetical protein